ncbi:MAG TPA: type II CAAX endopeptidase family protein [Pyrinomonadaceae bacterium]|nr:type II CAAX endopeptidase family protein [Pyrinomonadaceae bacterium]
MREIFINEVGRLRSGWRLLIFIAAFIALSLLLVTLARVVFIILPGDSSRAAEFGAELIFRFGLLAAALGAGCLCARYLEGLPWRSLGLTFHSGWLRDLIFGFAIGFASLVVAVAIASRGLSFSLSNTGWSSIVRSMIGSAVLLFVAALAEEAMFRGYGLQTLSRAKLAWLGVLLTSVPFALVHLSNPNVVPGVTFANTALAGIWLAAAYLRTRSLWLPLGVHWAWNWALGWFFGLPVSGIQLVSNPLLQGQDSGPKWLTGGSYGIEGGVACTIALILFTVFLWKTRWVSATPELKQMTSEENPATSEPVLSIRPANDHA